MNRAALVLILVAMPLLTAGMLAQNDDRSRNRSASASRITADGGPATQYFNGQWFNGSDFTPDPFSIVSPFSISAKSVRTSLNSRGITGAVNPNRAQLRTFNNFRAVSAPGGVTRSFGYFQPIYETPADAKLVNPVRSRVAQWYLLRYVAQTQHQPAQFAFEWHQDVRAAESRTAAHAENVTNLRNSTAARAHKPQRAPSFRHDQDSEISCLISEEDVKPALQNQIVVVSSVDLAKLGPFTNIEPLGTWSRRSSRCD